MREWKNLLLINASKFNFPIHKPIADLTDKQYKILWEGNEHVYGIDEFFKDVEQQLYKVQYRVLLSRYRGRTQCPDCNGSRLRKEALYIKVDGKHIGELSELQAKDLKIWFDELLPPPIQFLSFPWSYGTFIYTQSSVRNY